MWFWLCNKTPIQQTHHYHNSGEMSKKFCSKWPTKRDNTRHTQSSRKAQKVDCKVFLFIVSSFNKKKMPITTHFNIFFYCVCGGWKIINHMQDVLYYNKDMETVLKKMFRTKFSYHIVFGFYTILYKACVIKSHWFNHTENVAPSFLFSSNLYDVHKTHLHLFFYGHTIITIKLDAQYKSKP